LVFTFDEESRIKAAMRAGNTKMIKVERTFTIHRPVEEVFAYLCDVEHGPRYTSGQREAHQTSTGPVGIGTTFATSGKFPRRGSRFEITEYERDRRLAWKSASGAPTTTTWAFQPAGPSTRITFTRVAEAYRLGRFQIPDSLVPQLGNARIDRDLATLKELLAVTRKPTAKGW
jgi:uncharacterized membrane protein